MFEYLMPPLFQRQYEGSMLTQSCHAALRKQQHYGRQHRVPWGISESAFGALAINADYHYRSFGVPGLGTQTRLGQRPGHLTLLYDDGADARSQEPLTKTYNICKPKVRMGTGAFMRHLITHRIACPSANVA